MILKCTAVLSLIAGLLPIAAANAADTMPTRKPGLWEVTVEHGAAAGQPGMVSKQCVDATTDAKLQQLGNSQDCTSSAFKRTGSTFTVDSVCKFGGSTATTQIMGSGDFDSAYKMDMKSKYQPPLNGMSEGSAKMSAKFLGPCTADMKPGDMILPGGMKVNIMQMGQPPARPAR